MSDERKQSSFLITHHLSLITRLILSIHVNSRFPIQKVVMLTIAIAKGRMQDAALALLARAGVSVSEAVLASRRLAVEDEGGRYRFVFVKPADVPVYVEHGIADCGVVGRDVLLETGADVLQPLDLKIARCRIAVAAREGAYTGRAGVLH